MAPPPRLCTVLNGTRKVILFLVGTSSGRCLVFTPSAAVRPGTQLATRMDITGTAQSPPFLATPATPARPPARRQALLLHRLGPEGLRIFGALPQPTSSPPAAAAAGEAGKSSKPDRPDSYDAALLTLTRHFAARCNVRVERQRFRECRQLSGKPAVEFALALLELSAYCNVAAQADENMCDEFVAVITWPRLRERLLLEGDTLTFDPTVEIAQLREQSARESEALANPLHGDGSQPDATVEGAVILTAGHAVRRARALHAHQRHETPAASFRTPAPTVTLHMETAAHQRLTRLNAPHVVCRCARHNVGESSARVHEVVPDEDAASVFSILSVHTDKRTARDGPGPKKVFLKPEAGPGPRKCVLPGPSMARRPGSGSGLGAGPGSCSALLHGRSRKQLAPSASGELSRVAPAEPTKVAVMELPAHYRHSV
ncbi:hypothetical protein HPB47_013339 [Ixodes persulcatus]|uniref:Uncharacterized protein n=1 Tax=Ixodes persulcatus TaxID=34615 RepID=A0AC60R1F2_IXOPE|nr:hypothetical protein HPB47_013339 [Ixodes persulcatus]